MFKKSKYSIKSNDSKYDQIRLKRINEKNKLEKLKKEEEQLVENEINIIQNNISDLEDNYRIASKDKNYEKMNDLKNEIDNEKEKLDKIKKEMNIISKSKESIKIKLKDDIKGVNKKIDELRQKVKKQYKLGNYIKVNKIEKDIKELKNKLNDYSHEYKKIIKEGIKETSKHLKNLNKKVQKVEKKKTIESFSNSEKSSDEYTNLLNEIKKSKESLNTLKLEDKKRIEKEILDVQKEAQILKETKRIAIKLNDVDNIVNIGKEIKNLKKKSLKLKIVKIDKLNKNVEKSKIEIERLKKRLSNKNLSKTAIKEIKKEIENENENLNKNRFDLMRGDNNNELKNLYKIKTKIEKSENEIKRLERKYKKENVESDKTASKSTKTDLDNEKDKLLSLKDSLKEYIEKHKEKLSNKLNDLKDDFIKLYKSKNFFRATEIDLEIDFIKDKLENIENEDTQNMEKRIREVNSNIIRLEKSYFESTTKENNKEDKKKVIEIEKKILNSNEEFDRLNNENIEKIKNQINFQKKDIKYLLDKYELVKHDPKKEKKVRNEIQYIREKIEKLEKYILNNRAKQLEKIKEQITLLERKFFKIINDKTNTLTIKYEKLINNKKELLKKIFKEEIIYQEKNISDLRKKYSKEKDVKKAEEIDNNIIELYKKLNILKSKFSSEKQNENSMLEAAIVNLTNQIKDLLAIPKKGSKTETLIKKLQDDLRDKKLQLIKNKESNKLDKEVEKSSNLIARLKKEAQLALKKSNFKDYERINEQIINKIKENYNYKFEQENMIKLDIRNNKNQLVKLEDELENNKKSLRIQQKINIVKHTINKLMNNLNKMISDNKQKIEADYELATLENNRGLIIYLNRLNKTQTHKLDKLIDEQNDILSSEIENLKKLYQNLRFKYKDSKINENEKLAIKLRTEMKEVKRLINRLRNDEKKLVKDNINISMVRIKQIEKILNKRHENFSNKVSYEDNLRREYLEEKNKINAIRREEDNKIRMEISEKINERNDLELELKKAMATQNKYNIREYNTQIEDITKDVEQLQDTFKEKNNNEIATTKNIISKMRDNLLFEKKANNFNKILEIEKNIIDDENKISKLYKNIYNAANEEKNNINQNIEKLKKQQILEKKKENKIKLAAINVRLNQFNKRHDKIENDLNHLFKVRGDELKTDIKELNEKMFKYKKLKLTRKAQELRNIILEKRADYVALKDTEREQIEDLIDRLYSNLKRSNNNDDISKLEKKLTFEKNKLDEINREFKYFDDEKVDNLKISKKEIENLLKIAKKEKDTVKIDEYTLLIDKINKKINKILNTIRNNTTIENVKRRLIFLKKEENEDGGLNPKQKAELQKELNEEKYKIIKIKVKEEENLIKEINNLKEKFKSLESQYKDERTDNHKNEQTRRKIMNEHDKLFKLEKEYEKLIKSNIKFFKEEYNSEYQQGNIDFADKNKKYMNIYNDKLDVEHNYIKVLMNKKLFYIKEEIESLKIIYKKNLTLGNKTKIINTNKKLTANKIELYKLQKMIEEVTLDDKYKIKNQTNRLNKKIKNFNEQQKVYILEKNEKMIKLIDKLILEEKDNINKLKTKFKAVNVSHKKYLVDSIKELNDKIPLLEAEFEIVKKYNNTFRMSEIQKDITDKKYKIQLINDEINLLNKEKTNDIEQQINSLKKYISELEDENLNSNIDINETIYKKNEDNIEASNAEIKKLKDKLKDLHKQEIKRYNYEIQNIFEKLSNFEKDYKNLKSVKTKNDDEFRKIEKNINIEKEKLHQYKSKLLELNKKDIFITNLDIQYYKGKIQKLNEYYKKAKILQNKSKINKIIEKINKYSITFNKLVEYLKNLKINNEEKIEREVKHVYDKLETLKLFKKRAINDGNKYKVEKINILIDDERYKLEKLTNELRVIRKDKDNKLANNIKKIRNKITKLGDEYKKAKKVNNKKLMSVIEKKEEALQPKLKKLENEYFKLRNIEQNRMLKEIEFLSKKMTELEQNLNIGNVEKNKLRLQELAKELTQKKNAYTKYTLVSLKKK